MELHFTRRGRGEPLLLIQGMSGTHLSWGEPFLEELAKDFDVVAYDHRGIGFSPKAEGPFSIADLADDAAALMDRLGWDRAHVLGISMGGMVAQQLVLRQPERVRTLALGCTYCGGPGAQLTSPEVGQLLAAGWTSGDVDQAIRTGFEVNVSEAFAATPGAYDAFKEMALGAPAKVPTIMLQVQAIGQHDVQDQLGTVAAPTLVVHGTEDRMLPVANGRLIAERIPGARYEEMEGVGHLFWWEQPERSAQLVREHALGA